MISPLKFVDFQFRGYDQSALAAVLRGSPSKRFATELGQEKKTVAKAKAPVDTGKLRDSIGYRVIDDAETGWIVEIYAMADYAIYVEFGTVNMGAQPFLRPALYSQSSVTRARSNPIISAEGGGADQAFGDTADDEF